jgi:hypothetical protein
MNNKIILSYILSNFINFNDDCELDFCSRKHNHVYDSFLCYHVQLSAEKFTFNCYYQEINTVDFKSVYWKCKYSLSLRCFLVNQWKQLNLVIDDPDVHFLLVCKYIRHV